MLFMRMCATMLMLVCDVGDDGEYAAQSDYATHADAADGDGASDDDAVYAADGDDAAANHVEAGESSYDYDADAAGASL